MIKKISLLLLVLLVTAIMALAQEEATLTIHYRNSQNWSAPVMHWGFEYYQNVVDLKATGQDAYGVYYRIEWQSDVNFLSACFNDGKQVWDGIDRRIDKPNSFPTEIWIKNGDAAVYHQIPVDVVPPTVNITFPEAGASLKGKVTLNADANDNQSVAQVIFFYGNQKIGVAANAPYRMEWNTAYIANGTYQLSAQAIDSTGNTGLSPQVAVTTQNPNLSPVANAGGKIYGVIGVATRFNAAASYDPNGHIVSYHWKDGEGGTMTGVTPSHIYNQTGEYTVILTVEDNEGAGASDTATVVIGDVAPRGDFREETIYFLMTTRFFDGDPGNNYRSPDPKNQNPESDPEWRGDFKGLVEKLDYIKALGFTAIWITPVVHNNSGYDFHGYHGYDFNKIDQRLESPGYDLQRLVNEVHSRGMKLVIDVVFNHSCNWGAKGLFEPVNNPELNPQQQFLDRVRQMFTSEYYHDGWLSSWESYDEQAKTIAGDCVDFNTEDEKTRRYVIDCYNRMIDMGVDAFRIDTVKHISRYIFNRYFNPAFKARGGNNFYMFGEVCTRVRSVWNREIPALSRRFTPGKSARITVFCPTVKQYIKTGSTTTVTPATSRVAVITICKAMNITNPITHKIRD